jgi:hypothetical protein
MPGSKTPLLVAVLMGCAAACAPKPPPSARVGSSEATIRAARELGAARIPESRLHLEQADEELARARRFLADGEHDKASWLLARSEVDAQLAIAIAKEADARARAERAQARARAVAGGGE